MLRRASAPLLRPCALARLVSWRMRGLLVLVLVRYAGIIDRDNTIARPSFLVPPHRDTTLEPRDARKVPRVAAIPETVTGRTLISCCAGATFAVCFVAVNCNRRRGRER